MMPCCAHTLPWSGRAGAGARARMLVDSTAGSEWSAGSTRNAETRACFWCGRRLPCDLASAENRNAAAALALAWARRGLQPHWRPVATALRPVPGVCCALIRSRRLGAAPRRRPATACAARSGVFGVYCVVGLDRSAQGVGAVWCVSFAM